MHGKTRLGNEKRRCQLSYRKLNAVTTNAYQSSILVFHGSSLNRFAVHFSNVECLWAICYPEQILVGTMSESESILL